MTVQQLLTLIDDNILTNNNNEITAVILNPVLKDMVTQINGLTGDLGDLSVEASNLVEAINNISIPDSTDGIQVFTGVDNPNENPPASYSPADMYVRTLNATPIGLYIFTGVSWVLIQEASSGTEGSLPTMIVSSNDILMSATFADTYIYTGNSPTGLITFASPIASELNTAFAYKRICVVNQSDNIISTGLVGYIAITGSVSNEIRANGSLEVQSDGVNWYQIK